MRVKRGNVGRCDIIPSFIGEPQRESCYHCERHLHCTYLDGWCQGVSVAVSTRTMRLLRIGRASNSRNDRRRGSHKGTMLLTLQVR